MGEILPTYEDLLRKGVHIFYDRYKKQFPTAVGCAPGSVNLIGEHTDYNNGFVLPMALPMVTMVIGAPNHTSRINIYTEANVTGECSISFQIPDEVNLTSGEPAWANFVKGTVNYFEGASVPGFDAIIVSSIPMDAGLSSSAALELATYNFLEELTGSKTKNLILKPIICQRAEHNFAQRPCGIMDQFASTFAKKGYAFLLDCLNLDYNHVRFEDPSVAIIITNSNVARSLNALNYALRRNQCLLAAKIMKHESLREATTKDLHRFRGKMEDDIFHRARHVITEIQRTVDAAQALRKKDYTSLGLLMIQSHNSLRDDFEGSCPEVDDLVEITMDADGVYGSRIIGSGFGGCTLSLVKSECVESIIRHIKNNYYGVASFYTVNASSSTIDLKQMLDMINAENE